MMDEQPIHNLETYLTGPEFNRVVVVGGGGVPGEARDPHSPLLGPADPAYLGREVTYAQHSPTAPSAEAARRLAERILEQGGQPRRWVAFTVEHPLQLTDAETGQPRAAVEGDLITGGPFVGKVVSVKDERLWPTGALGLRYEIREERPTYPEMGVFTERPFGLDGLTHREAIDRLCQQAGVENPLSGGERPPEALPPALRSEPICPHRFELRNAATGERVCAWCGEIQGG